MTNKPRKSLKQSNPALMRAIYWAIIIGIAAVFAIVTLEAMLGIFRDRL
ncbi:hypothetical protein [Rheinheimera sp. NSM]